MIGFSLPVQPAALQRFAAGSPRARFALIARNIYARTHRAPLALENVCAPRCVCAGGPPPALGAVRCQRALRFWPRSSAPTRLLDGTYLDDDMDVRIGVLGMPILAACHYAVPVDSKETTARASLCETSAQSWTLRMAFLLVTGHPRRSARRPTRPAVRVHVERPTSISARPTRRRRSSTPAATEDTAFIYGGGGGRQRHSRPLSKARTARAPNLPFWARRRRSCSIQLLGFRMPPC